MAPTLVFDGDGLELAIGAGGRHAAAHRARRRARGRPDEGLAPQEAVDRPRLHPAGDVVNAEPGVDEAWLAAARGSAAGGAPLAGAAPLLRRRQRVGRGAARGGRSAPAAAPSASSPRRAIRRTARAAAASARRRGRSARRARASLSKTRSSRSRSQSSTHEPLAVEVALVVEQVRLDPPLGAAVVRIDADRDRRAVVARPRRRRCRRPARAAPGRREVRGREPERAAALVAADDHPLDLERAARAAAAASLDVAGVASSRMRLDETSSTSGTAPDVEAEPREELEIAGALAPEAEAVARGDDLGADRRAGTPRERLRLERRELVVNASTSTSSTPAACEQLEPPLDRREQLDPVAEHRRGCGSNVTTVGRERPPRVDRGPNDRRWPRWTPSNVPIATARGAARAPRAAARRSRRVPAAGRRARARRRGPRRGRARAPRPAAARAPPTRAAGLGSTSASSTSNGPTSVRRSVVQWPPSASAIDAHVRPRADAQLESHDVSPVYAMTSSACTIERRSGHLHLDAPPREPVRALTADLHRRRGGDRQLHLAAEALERRSSSGSCRERRGARAARPRDRRSRSSPSGRRP